MTATSLPQNWKLVTLRDVASDRPNAIVDGPFGSNLKADDYIESGVPVLQGKNITNDAFKWFDVRFISEKKAEELKRSSARPSDILLVKIGSIGYSAIIDSLNGFDFAIIPANLVKVTPNSEIICTKYLHRWLTSPDSKRYLVANASKTAQPALSLGKIKELPVPLPSLPEQRRIAAVLDQADALRAKSREALSQLDRLTQSIFSELIAGNDHVIRRITIAECMEAIIDYRGKTPTKTEIGVPLVTARVVKGGELLQPNEFIAEKDYDSWMRRGLPKSGDVLFTTEAPLGEVAQIDGRKVALAQRLLLLRGRPDLLDNTFLKFAMSSQEVRRQIDTRSTGSTVKGIRQSELRKVAIPIPPLKVQQNFTQKIHQIEKLRLVIRGAINQHDLLFESLQHRAFRGEL